MAALLSYAELTRASLLIPGPTTLLDRVFTRTETFSTREIILDELESLQVVLPEIVGEEIPPTLEKLYATEASNTVIPPEFAAREPISARDIYRRQVGANPYITTVSEVTDPFEQEVARRLNLLKAAKKRRLEALRASALQGQVSLRNGVTISYGIPADQKVAMSNGASWKSGRAIVDDIRAAQEKIGERTGLAATMAICGSTAANLILNDATVQKLLDIRNVSLGGIDIRLEGAAIRLGVLHGVEIWEYFGSTQDAQGNYTRLIPDDTFILVAPDGGFEDWYAGIEFLDEVNRQPTGRIFKGEELVDMFPDPMDPKRRWFMEIRTRPLPIIRYPKAVFVYSNVNA